MIMVGRTKQSITIIDGFPGYDQKVTRIPTETVDAAIGYLENSDEDHQFEAELTFAGVLILRKSYNYPFIRFFVKRVIDVEFRLNVSDENRIRGWSEQPVEVNYPTGGD